MDHLGFPASGLLLVEHGGGLGGDVRSGRGPLARRVLDARARAVLFEATRRAEGCMLQGESFLLGLDSRDRQRAAHRDESLALRVPSLDGTVHFISFQTVTMEAVVEFVRRRFFLRHIKTLACTGGGAYVFAPLLDAKLGIDVRRVDEMDVLLRGLTFTRRHAADECYTFRDVVPRPTGVLDGTRTSVPTPPASELYPFLLVSIGLGVSILKVSSARAFERVSGSSLGGGTFWGLLRALSRLQSFDEAMDAAASASSALWFALGLGSTDRSVSTRASHARPTPLTSCVRRPSCWATNTTRWASAAPSGLSLPGTSRTSLRLTTMLLCISTCCSPISRNSFTSRRVRLLSLSPLPSAPGTCSSSRGRRRLLSPPGSWRLSACPAAG